MTMMRQDELQRIASGLRTDAARIRLEKLDAFEIAARLDALRGDMAEPVY